MAETLLEINLHQLQMTTFLCFKKSDKINFLTGTNG
jgi:hypothetical protein